MSVEYTIRRAYPSDANDIAAAHRDSIRSIGPRFYPPTVVDDWGAGLTPDIYVNAIDGGEVFFIAVGQIDNQPVVLATVISLWCSRLCGDNRPQAGALSALS